MGKRIRLNLIIGGVNVAPVINNPNAYVSKTVIVSGNVEEIHSPRAFNMGSGISAGELLVLGYADKMDDP